MFGVRLLFSAEKKAQYIILNVKKAFLIALRSYFPSRPPACRIDFPHSFASA